VTSDDEVQDVPGGWSLDDELGPGEGTLDAGRFREVMGHFVTGVTVVTAMDGPDPVGFTCQAFASLSLQPPLVVVAPGKSSTTWPRIAGAGDFCVNILSEGQEALCRDFAVSGGDKFAGVGWHPGANGAPVLEGALAWVECRLVGTYDAGDHELVVGHVHEMGVDRGAQPLVYYRGGFGRFES
jgi:3-hydroxy-9,10-secoandrosta-1,3,5(10)-triene-9,17-dione monooxygenase reductase component